LPVNARSLQRPRWIAAAIVLLASFAAIAGSSPTSGSPVDVSSSAAPVSDGASLDDAKGSGLRVPNHVIAGGGGTSRGGAFAIVGTVGSVDPDPLQPSIGGAFTVVGGFWAGQTPRPPPADAVFANGFEPMPP
jgi:hypothetical protein